MKLNRELAILISALTLSGCQATTTQQQPRLISYNDLTPELREWTLQITKCALAMVVTLPESYNSMDDVYFHNGDTYGDITSRLSPSTKKNFLDEVSLRAEKYSNLHDDGNIAPVMLEYVFSDDCRILYFPDSFNNKYSNLIDQLNQLESANK